MITVSNVANASQGELLCMTYEIFLYHVEAAKLKSDKEQQQHIDQAIEVIKCLVGDLDFSVEIAKNLFSIYVYVQNMLVNHRYQADALEKAYKLMDMIYQAYKEVVEKEVSRNPVMQNAESIYAGVTYGKGTLNEMVGLNNKRGYYA